MKKVTVRKIWNNRVSVKDYDLKIALQKGGLIIAYDGLEMKVSTDLVRYKLQGNPDSKPIASKFNNKPPYCLYDFQWKPEKKIKTEPNNQRRLI